MKRSFDKNCYCLYGVWEEERKRRGLGGDNVSGRLEGIEKGARKKAMERGERWVQRFSEKEKEAHWAGE